MFAMITTEEYKKLIIAEQDLAQAVDTITICNKEKQEAEDSLKELLLMLTKGEKKVQWEDGIKWFDIAPAEKIAEYLNKHYFKDGILTFTKENNNE